MIIKNAKVYSEDGIFIDKDIYIYDELISDRSTDSDVIDADGLYAIPGLIDIHLHGCNGHDFCEGTKESLECIAKYEATHGITTIIPASMTLPEKQLVKIYKNLKSWDNSEGARIIGGYMEGPFVSYSKRGAQKDTYIRKPDSEMFERLYIVAGGLIKFVTVAPEVNGAMDFIRKYKNVAKITIAHTATDYDIMNEAIEAGAGQITHLYNAMEPIHHRKPGPIIAASEHDNVMAEIICDDVHVHPAIVRSTFKLFSKDRIIFISDSMMATGMPDGEYELGGQPVFVNGNKALLGDGTIAGSVTDLMGCVKVAITCMNISLEDAIRCATVNPAKAAGIFDMYGSISPGKYADIVLLDKDLNIKTVFVRGTIL